MLNPSPQTSCRVDAPAKLNLCLELLGRMGNGFHQLRTLMATIGLRDTLVVSPRRGDLRLSLRVTGSPRLVEGVPTDGANLVVRALDRLRSETGSQTGSQTGAEVRLVKRIPSQAGLGGGSSDAAAALVGANLVWGLGLPVARLAEIGAKLGSDIPFFVHAISDPRCRAAVATGRGERIEPTSAMSGLPVVVLAPPTGLSTAAVYAACEAADYTTVTSGNRTEAAAAAVARGDRRGIVVNLTNDLQAAAKRVGGWLEQVPAAFDAVGCVAHQLSGSGSAYFGLARTMGEARRIAARLRALSLGQVLATTIG